MIVFTATKLGQYTVTGCGWNVRYQGHSSALSAWSAANADGFYLAPGASFTLVGQTPVVRA